MKRRLLIVFASIATLATGLDAHFVLVSPPRRPCRTAWATHRNGSLWRRVRQRRTRHTAQSRRAHQREHRDEGWRHVSSAPERIRLPSRTLSRRAGAHRRRIATRPDGDNARHRKRPLVGIGNHSEPLVAPVSGRWTVRAHRAPDGHARNGRSGAEHQLQELRAAGDSVHGGTCPQSGWRLLVPPLRDGDITADPAKPLDTRWAAR